MALPTTGLLGHFNSRTAVDLFDTFSGGVLNGNPTNGGSFLYWDDRINATVGGNQLVLGEGGTGPSFEWHSDTVLNLPSVKILGGHLSAETVSGVASGRPTYLPNAAKSLLISFWLDPASTIPNHASVFQNCVLVGDARNGYFGLLISQPSAGEYLLHAYNWDGSAKSVSLAVEPSTPHVALVTHDGVNLLLSLDFGADVTTAAGATTNSTNLRVGDDGNNGTTTAQFLGRIGELATYNYALTADRAEAEEYFAPWLTAPATGVDWFPGTRVAGVARPYQVVPCGFRPPDFPDA